MRALDLFCGAGGASMGLHRAGFDVTGVDIKPQPRYPFKFIQADAMTFLGEPHCFFVGGSTDYHPELCDACGEPWRDERHQLDTVFDFIWASPPCQAYSPLRHRTRAIYPDLIDDLRQILLATRKPFVIENVPGAPLIAPIMLCGSSFGLKVRRHRQFECYSWFRLSLVPPCQHRERPIDVSGTGSRRRGERKDGKGGNPNKPRNLAEAREAMGIDWMNRYEISQAIPPAYSEFIGKAFLASVEQRVEGWA